MAIVRNCEGFPARSVLPATCQPATLLYCSHFLRPSIISDAAFILSVLCPCTITRCIYFIRSPSFHNLTCCICSSVLRPCTLTRCNYFIRSPSFHNLTRCVYSSVPCPSTITHVAFVHPSILTPSSIALCLRYLIAEPTAVLLGLLDVLLAYAYDHRTTSGDPSVESCWTVCKLATTLSWLEVRPPACPLAVRGSAHHANILAAIGRQEGRSVYGQETGSVKCVCMYVCVYVCVRECVCICVCACLRVHVCACVCVYVCCMCCVYVSVCVTAWRG